MAHWSRLEFDNAEAFNQARLTLHWSAQILGSVGFAFADPSDDDSHSNLLWDASNRRFVGRQLPSGIRGFIDIVEFEAGIVDSEGDEHLRFGIDGKTMTDAFGEMESGLSILNFSGAMLKVPSYDLPDHPVAHGGHFVAPARKELLALQAWYDCAHEVLSEFTRDLDGASEVRCWPHHFDIAVLVGLDEYAHLEESRSVGLGMTPGDGGIEEPYFYITPWPAPNIDVLPQLSAGTWRDQGWTGGVLKASEILQTQDRLETCQSFVKEGFAGAKQALAP